VYRTVSVLAEAAALNIRQKKTIPAQLATLKNFTEETRIPTSMWRNSLLSCGGDNSNPDDRGRIESRRWDRLFTLAKP
jgi:hypothetical protein